LSEEEEEEEDRFVLRTIHFLSIIFYVYKRETAVCFGVKMKIQNII